jgi:trigger factor
MKQEIAKNVNREVKRRLTSLTKEKVMDAILAITPIQVPTALVALEAGRLLDQAKQDFVSRGMKASEFPLTVDIFTEQATRRVSLGLILSELVSANKLEATPEQVRAMIEEFAESYEDPSEMIHWYYEKSERLEGPTSMVLEDNVVAFVLSKAQVTKKSLTFNEVMGQA